MSLVHAPAAGTLGRYFGGAFLRAFLAVFVGAFALIVLLDYIEMMRHTANEREASAWYAALASICRVPQLTERILPFAALIAAMWSFLSLSRRLELVVARAAGMSAWQFVTPAVAVSILLGILATIAYNPIAAVLNEKSQQMEMQMTGKPQSGLQFSFGGYWIRQKSDEGQAIIRAVTTSEQGIRLGGVIVFAFDNAGHFKQRIEAKTATLHDGYWELEEARFFGDGAPPLEHATYRLASNLTSAQVRENFAVPESVSFWDLPSYIDTAERSGLSASAYRLQYQKLLARPFLMSAMVLLAGAVSLRFFRFGGVQKMVMWGILSGFLLYMLSKLTEDLSKADLLPPITAAWLPVLVGGLTGVMALLYQEDG